MDYYPKAISELVEEFEKLRQALGMGKLKPSQRASEIILNLIKE